ncbi:MAG: TetR/AcrR family transcriptional regulator [Chloroflexi bacterium]|nr:TetR/AcrR family transcriptional regulator [Chloroflexota bacterium]
MDEQEKSAPKQRVLDVAEQLFIQRGYAAVKLHDIAQAVGVRQASLYYHFPEGKEQLFVAMATRVFRRHQIGIQMAIEQAKPTLAAQLQAVIEWFAEQPPLHLLGMIHADMPALSAGHAAALYQVVYQSMFAPVRQMFSAAQARNEIRMLHPDLLTGSFLSLMDGFHYGQSRPGAPPKAVIIDEIITLLLDGLHPRPN